MGVNYIIYKYIYIYIYMYVYILWVLWIFFFKINYGYLTPTQYVNTKLWYVIFFWQQLWYVIKIIKYKT